MLRTFEGDERIVQAIGLPIGLSLTPIAAMPGEAKQNFMMWPKSCVPDLYSRRAVPGVLISVRRKCCRRACPKRSYNP